MLLSFRWLLDFVKLPSTVTVEDVAKSLTLAGIEVASLKPLDSLSDTVLDIQITPNRPDALSHVGIARELSAIFDARFHLPNFNVKELGGHTHDVVQVKIEDRKACPRYACRVIDGVEIKDSPKEIQLRLEALGIRSVNNVVDITNLVLLERGHPLHAFDWDKLAKERNKVVISVRKANGQEQLLTLDGKSRDLSSKDLIIADEHGPIALAGVMGGQLSEVTNKTQTVLLESAYFDPSVVRQGARRHGLSTEASYRFERGTDPNGVMLALDEAAQLIGKYAGGRVRREAVDVYPSPILPEEVSMSQKFLAQLSALPKEEIEESKIRAKFLALGIETVGRLEDSLTFRLPTFRPDLKREIDLVEEVMRLVSYDKVPLRLSYKGRIQDGEQSSALASPIRRAYDVLVSCGFFEAINYSFGSSKRFDLFKEKGDSAHVEIENPLGEDFKFMRQSLLPGLLGNLDSNIRKGNSDVRLFELGVVFQGESDSGKTPNMQLLKGNAKQDAWAVETRFLSGVLAGCAEGCAFDKQATKADFFDLKGVVEALLLKLRVNKHFLNETIAWERLGECKYFHPGQSALLKFKRSKGRDLILGRVGLVHPDILSAFEIPVQVYAFELDWELLESQTCEEVDYMNVSKYPSVTRDIALILDKNLTAASIEEQVRLDAKLSPFVSDFKIFDVYEGENIAKGKKSVAFSLTLQDSKQTFKDEFVNELIDGLIKRFERNLGASIR